MEKLQQPTFGADPPREDVSGGSPETTGGPPVLPRLPVDVVEHIHRLLGGDARVEQMVEDFIRETYGAVNLFEIPAAAATQIIRRPADFLTAVKKHAEPGLRF